ncbi:hypothetical protein ACLOJK_024357 [Asimina triloba]
MALAATMAQVVFFANDSIHGNQQLEPTMAASSSSPFPRSSNSKSGEQRARSDQRPTQINDGDSTMIRPEKARPHSNSNDNRSRAATASVRPATTARSSQMASDHRSITDSSKRQG